MEPKSSIVEDKFVVIIGELAFQAIFENFLQKSKGELDKLNIILNPNLQQYLLLFCKENPNFFTEIENIFKAIIKDNVINSKDIPQILNLVVKVYELTKSKKQVPNVDPYDLIELMLRILFVSYMQSLENPDNSNNEELANQLTEQIINLIRVSVELLKLPAIKNATKGCFSCFKNA